MHKNKRANIALALMVVFLSACGSGGNATEATTIQATEQVSQEEQPWAVTVEAAEKAESLANSQTVKQYSGDLANLSYSETPGEGKAFLLLKLNIKKQISGKSTFSWKDCYIEDENGNKYTRMADDTFLENYGFKRIKSVDLTMGENEGYMCTEVNADAKQFWFVYDTGSGENKITIELK